MHTIITVLGEGLQYYLKKKKRNISAANVKKEIQFLMKPDYGY